MERAFRIFSRGHLFKPSGTHSWSQSHAQVPFITSLNGSPVVTYSTRGAKDKDGNYVSVGASVPITWAPDGESLMVGAESNQPIMLPGKIGDFDDCGVMPGSCLELEGETFMFYGGWTTRGTVPYEWAVGIAQLDKNSNVFVRKHPGPVIGQSLESPFLNASPIVFRYSGTFHMFYLSGLEWFSSPDTGLESVYRLRHAKSHDATHWVTERSEVVKPRTNRETQTSSAIFKLGEEFFMLYSFRDADNFRLVDSANYRIGIAQSTDLDEWEDLGPLEFEWEGGTSLWDRRMQGYPSVFTLNGKLFVLYCGNDFGREGFGYGELVGAEGATALTGPNF